MHMCLTVRSCSPRVSFYGVFRVVFNALKFVSQLQVVVSCTKLKVVHYEKRAHLIIMYLLIDISVEKKCFPSEM